MIQEKEKFYEECGGILGIPHTYQTPYSAYSEPNRWNNRAPGNGRFPGYGIITMYSKRCIHIMLRHPENVTKTCGSPEEALDFLRSIMG